MPILHFFQVINFSQPIDKGYFLCYYMVMSFCKFSPSFATSNKTMVDNEFINHFLPHAPDACVKVYLLGLSKCSTDCDNDIKYFANTLNITEQDVISCFMYWQEQGLVQVLSTDPIEVRYLPVYSHSQSIKKYKVDKYTDFNIQVQEILSSRQITPNEFAEYYNLIENHHITEGALIDIIKYCADYKGFNVRHPYIITVARDWEREGVHTHEDVENKINDLGLADDKISLLLSSMGSKRKIQLEDKKLLDKWLNAYGYELNVILYIVKMLNLKKRKIDMDILDKHISKYYEMKLLSTDEIDAYENEKENLFFIATAVNKELGVFYEDLTKEIDSYVVDWVNKGFDKDTLVTIADNCFKSSIRTLEGFNNIIMKLYKLGIVTLDSYREYLSDNLSVDNEIKQVLDTLKVNRFVNNNDRAFYRTWTSDWGFSLDIILYACTLAVGKSNAIVYLNKILANWTGKVKTLDDAKNMQVTSTANTNFIHNNYTKEQIASFITNLNEVEV